MYARDLGPLLCDKYALTMTAALFEAERAGRTGLLEASATFQHFIRDLPTTGILGARGEGMRSAYLVSAGLGTFCEWLDGWKWTPKHLAYLAEQREPDGSRTFSDAFLEWLGEQRLKLDIDAVPEGELAFPREPLTRISGPVWQCYMVEAALLNIINAQSLFATVASHFVLAAQADGKPRPILEFGLRRAQDLGGLAPSRAAFIGGASSTSNMLAGFEFGIPTSGTFAHAFVMLFKDELDAFATWAKHRPASGVFLVDTYDTESGIQNAIDTCRKLNVPLVGIRLDSGRLDYLARVARKMLDEAGFTQAKIFATDSLNVAAINNLTGEQRAPIDVFGVGTNLVTAQHHPALGGVFKLSTVMTGEDAAVREVMKFSSSPVKATLPGAQDVLRFLEKAPDGTTRFGGDTLVPLGMPVGSDRLAQELISVNPVNPQDPKPFAAGTPFYRPIVPVVRGGKLIQPLPSLAESRARTLRSLEQLDPTHKNLAIPHIYVAGIEDSLHERQVARVRENNLASRRRAAARSGTSLVPGA